MVKIASCGWRRSVENGPSPPPPAAIGPDLPPAPSATIHLNWDADWKARLRASKRRSSPQSRVTLSITWGPERLQGPLRACSVWSQPMPDCLLPSPLIFAPPSGRPVAPQPCPWIVCSAPRPPQDRPGDRDRRRPSTGCFCQVDSRQLLCRHGTSAPPSPQRCQRARVRHELCLELWLPIADQSSTDFGQAADASIRRRGGASGSWPLVGRKRPLPSRP